MRATLAERLGVTVDDPPVRGGHLRKLLRHAIGWESVSARNLLEQFVGAALVDLATWDWYLTQLAILMNGQYDDRVTVPVEEQLTRIEEQGLSSLADDELAQLATNPVALMAARDIVLETESEAWGEMKTQAGLELVALLKPDSDTLPRYPVEPVNPSATQGVQLALGSKTHGEERAGDQQRGPWQWRGEAFEVDCMVVPNEAGDALRVSVNVDHLLLSSCDDSECSVSWRDRDDNEKASGASSSWNADCVEIPIPEGVSPDTGDVLVLRFQRRGPQGCQSLVELRLTLGEGVS